ncbi:MAG TPA: hypothetical protein VHC70_05580 [Phycisphaerales bacterium]|jgi:hypothetical protein|nr:hypothetical protein [Phycisphaerales bacterium]
MKLSRTTWTAAAVVALLAGGVMVWDASAQQPGSSQPTVQPGGEGRRPGRGPGGGGAGDGERGPRSKWAEEFRTEVREHPSMGRALVALHEAKDYMEKASNDFGGHKAASIKACDEAIKELKEAIKFDAKRERRTDRPGGKPGDAKPGDSKPADPPSGTSDKP